MLKFFICSLERRVLKFEDMGFDLISQASWRTKASLITTTKWAVNEGFCFFWLSAIEIDTALPPIRLKWECEGGCHHFLSFIFLSD